jgi:hypothetical protein
MDLLVLKLRNSGRIPTVFGEFWIINNYKLKLDSEKYVHNPYQTIMLMRIALKIWGGGGLVEENRRVFFGTVAIFLIS